MEENKYPEKAVEVIDKYFPKGDKRRGEALVLLAVAYNEGKGDEGKDEIGTSDFVMPEDKDRCVMLKESEIQEIIEELGRVPHELFAFLSYDKLIEKLKWKEKPKEEPKKETLIMDEETLKEEIEELKTKLKEKGKNAQFDFNIRIKEAQLFGFQQGYEKALDENDILYGEDAKRFLENMKKQEEKENA